MKISWAYNVNVGYCTRCVLLNLYTLCVDGNAFFHFAWRSEISPSTGLLLHINNNERRLSDISRWSRKPQWECQWRFWILLMLKPPIKAGTVWMTSWLRSSVLYQRAHHQASTLTPLMPLYSDSKGSRAAISKCLLVTIFTYKCIWHRYETRSKQKWKH